MIGGASAAALTVAAIAWRNRVLARQLRMTQEMLARATPARGESDRVTAGSTATTAATTATTATSTQGEHSRADRRALGHAAVANALDAMPTTEEWLALPARTALDALWDWDVPADRMRFSARWRELVGLPPAEVHRSTEEWWGRVHPSDRTQLHVDVAAQLASSESRFLVEHRVRHEDGRWLNLQWAGVILRDADGTVQRVTGSVRDMTAQRSAEERQRRDSMYDGLTGLPNRALAIDLLRRGINRARRQGERRFAVLLVDLDRFNLLNDSLGHAAGDELLKGVAQRLATAVRPGDVVARLGGDEFMLLLDEITAVADAESVADRVKLVLNEPLTAISHDVVVSASVGIVLHDPEITQPTDYLRDAELAMHGAKRAGRARHTVFTTDMRDGVRHRVSVEQDLRGAIDRDEFVVHYQPIWSLRGAQESLIGFEALIRWDHPKKGMLGAGEFVPIAEESDLIVTMGSWAMHRACRELVEIAANTPQALWVSVNVSARQLAERSLVGVVDRILHATGLEPARLKLEVTENVILHDEECARQALETLRAHGVRSLMDDFGTGHASLSYLHRLPIGSIKIDRYFVGRMDVSPECLEIVRSIITLARGLGMEVVAEGVEQEAQLAQLRDLGCHSVQGFLLARPLLAEEAIALVAALERNPTANPRVVLRDLGLAGGYRHTFATPVQAIEAA